MKTLYCDAGSVARIHLVRLHFLSARAATIHGCSSSAEEDGRASASRIKHLEQKSLNEAEYWKE